MLFLMTLSLHEAHAESPAEDWVKLVQNSSNGQLFTKDKILSLLNASKAIVESGTGNPRFWYIQAILNKELFR